ncbi:hypothetical protein [Calidifontibacter terrae]
MDQPHFRALRCGPDRVVLGISSRHPQLLTGLPVAVVDDLLQLPPLSAARWPQVFQRSGNRHLTSLLRTAMARMEPTDLRGLRVGVEGEGPVADDVRSLLHDLGVSDGSHPDVRVMIGGPVDLDPLSAPGPHLVLPVEVGSDQVVVGPLLRPDDGPCARCLHLRRADQFGPWPLVLAQLRTVRISEGPVSTAPELSRMATGLVGLVLRGMAAGHPITPGLALAVTTPEPVVEHRFWPIHPRCHCSGMSLVGGLEVAG